MKPITLKPKPIQRIPFKASVVRKMPRTAIKPRKIPKGTNAWIKAIPVSKTAHGSGHLQKRLWRLKSDFVRIRDWTAFGTFIDTNENISNWNDAQAGHYRSYNECRGMFKFHDMNIHAQTPSGNAWPTSTTWEKFADNLVERYGTEFIQAIDFSNKNCPIKITPNDVLKEMHRTLKMLGMMEEKPPYYKRVMSLLPH